MKRAKKILAVLLSMAMVLGMSVTAFAGSFTVSNVKDAKLDYVQVISADQTGTGIGSYQGWSFTNEAVAQAYIRGFDNDKDAVYSADKAKSVMQQLVETRPNDINAKIGRALAEVFNSRNNIEATHANEGNAITSDSFTKQDVPAGVYAIEALDPNYTYNFMAAYVGFTYDENGNGTVSDPTLEAKKQPIDKTGGKTSNVGDKVVSIGDVVSYTISTNVPYIDPLSINKTFQIYDEISGAAYDMNSITVMVDGVVAAANTYEIKAVNPQNGGDYAFAVSLNSLIDDANSNAKKEVVVSYNATIQKVSADNKALVGRFDDNTYGGEYGGGNEKLFTGTITLFKYDGDNPSAENVKKLQGAEFQISKNGTDGTPLQFVEKTPGITGAYLLSTNGFTTLSTNANGNITVEGLDTGKYYFTETKAPAGYSINSDEHSGELTVNNADGKATSIITTENVNVKDTQLSALPSTGGIGTTIFTVVGCIVMIGAAGLFFASRRKTSAK